MVAELSGPYTLGVTITTRWILSVLCSAVISSGSAVSGVYVRPANHGNLAGSPWICVWQSHAPAGTSKLTLVAGCDALAYPKRGCVSTPAAAAPSTNSRRPIMITSLVEGLSLLD